MGKAYEFEIWSSFENKYFLITITADSKKEAIKRFMQNHPHKKFRLLDDPIPD